VCDCFPRMRVASVETSHSKHARVEPVEPVELGLFNLLDR